MRILHLNTYDVLGGAALAAQRLHAGLRANGVNSSMFVRRRYGRSEGVMAFGAGVLGRFRRRWDHWFACRAGWHGPGRFTPGMVGGSLARRVLALAPDVVHLHWVADGFFDVRELARIGRPVVWTTHDMWSFTGGCHYAGSCSRYGQACGRCPLLGSRREDDLSRRMWERKRRAYDGLRLVGVAPSRWMQRAAQESALWRGRDVRVIPNGIDLARFAPAERASARGALGLPCSGVLMMAGANEFRNDPRKGFDLFCGVASRLQALDPRRYVFATFGTSPAGPYSVDGVEFIELGKIEDPSRLAAVYAAADVFVAPSREDNLPNTLIESLACGTPVASFSVGGIPDIVDDGINGCLASELDADGLAKKVHALALGPDGLGKAAVAARRKAEDCFSIGAMVRAHTALYEEILCSR